MVIIKTEFLSGTPKKPGELTIGKRVVNCKANWPVPLPGESFDCTGGPEMGVTPGGELEEKGGEIICQTKRCRYFQASSR